MAVNQDKKTKKWYFRCKYRDSFNEIKGKYQTGFESKREAQNAETDFMRISKVGTVATNVQFDDLVTLYLVHQKPRVGYSTYIDNRRMLEGICSPYWKKHNMTKLTINNITIWQNNLLMTKYQNSYLDKIQTTFLTLIRFSVDNNYLPQNVPTRIKKVSKPYEFRKEIQFFTHEEFKQFISVATDPLYYNLFSILYWCGLRIGEAVALTWNDIDFGRGFISVNKTYCFKSRQIKPPKTKNSYRVVYLSDGLIKSLQAFYDSEKHTTAFDNDCILFGFNKHIDDNTIKRHKDLYCKNANVKRIRIHDFRHSHVSLLINNGCTAFEISQRLGHSMNMVENVYSHLFKSTQQNMINLLNKLEKKG